MLLDQVLLLVIFIILSIITCAKILNLQSFSLNKLLLCFFTSIALSICVILLKPILPYMRFALMILIASLFISISMKVKIDAAIIGTTIAVGLNYGIVLTFTLFSTALLFLLRQPENDVLGAIISTLMQGCFVFFLFRIKRFKKGILFLQKKGSGSIGLMISGAILIAVTLINGRNISNEVTLGLIIGAVLSVAGLFFWWRRGLTMLYRSKVRERNMQEYEKILADKEAQIQQLQETNDFLSKLIHRDNKLLPAMAEAVLYFSEDTSINIQRKALSILKQIQDLMRERTQAIAKHQREHKVLPTTKDDLIDGVMRHMLAKASERNILFDMAVAGDLSSLTDKTVPSLKWQTLCADLIENAIIAVSYREYKRILVTIDFNDGCCQLTIQDTGIPFQAETLALLGQRRASTHLQEGGSGIGYMMIFEILREAQASLIITEHEPKPYGFTKSVRISFDGHNDYIVRSYKEGESISIDIKSARAQV